MQYEQLGQTGLFVSRFCLGAMTFGGADNPAGNAIGRLSAGEADAIVGMALDAGINFIDTNFAAWQLMKALGVSARAGLEPFVSIQSFYSIAGRDVEAEIIPAVTDQKLSLLCWSPLAGGLLSGKFDRHGNSDASARRAKIAFPPVDEARTFDVIDGLKAVAQRRKSEPAQIALAWLLAKPAVTSVIVGIKRPDQLAANLSALDLVLKKEDFDQLDEASRIPASYPGWIQSYNAAGRVPAGYPFDGPNWTLGERPR